MSMSRILIAAAHKSSGKTTVSLGIARALRRQGLAVQSFKKGPDYIDPMWHARATGRACYNLDFNTQSRDEITAMLAAHSADADLALIEANMGLYDGVDTEGRDGNAALAKLIGTPVILVVDTEGMTRGIAPLLLGYRVFDPEVHIAGVVLNRVASARHEQKLRAAVERYTEIPVIGALHRDLAFHLPERHLGLTTPAETGAVDAFIDGVAEAVTKNFDLAMLKSIAALAMPLLTPPAASARRTSSSFLGETAGRDGAVNASTRNGSQVRIAVARDAAFGFYYPDDLASLERAGAELVVFDAEQAQRLPKADGLFIGGGFPEMRMDALSANASLRADIRAKVLGGLPTYAECGGLMYLTEAIRWGEQRAEMVGVIPAEAVMHDRPQGRGQIVIETTAHLPWGGPWGGLGDGLRDGLRDVTLGGAAAGQGIPTTIRAHEFHHAEIVDLPDDLAYAFKMKRGTGVNGRHDGIVIANMVAGFAHLRSTEAFPWAERFVDFVRRHKTAGLLPAAYVRNATRRPAAPATEPLTA